MSVVSFPIERGSIYHAFRPAGNKSVVVVNKRLFPVLSMERGVAEIYLNKKLNDTLWEELEEAAAKLAETAQTLEEGEKAMLAGKKLEVVLSALNTTRDARSAVDSVVLYRERIRSEGSQLITSLLSLILTGTFIFGFLLTLAGLWKVVEGLTRR